MKKLYLCAIACLLFAAATAQNCDISEIIRFHYQEDAKYHAIRRMNTFNAPAQNNIRIPEIWLDTILEGMSAIFDDLSPAAEEVFYDYCIKQLAKPVSGTLVVGLYETTSWLNNWENGIIETGDPFLDDLFLEYGIDSVASSSNNFPFYTIHYRQLLNEAALAETIETHSQVDFATLNRRGGDGKRLDYNYSDGVRYYDFSVGWGDCPAGCIYRYYWRFEVDENCQVTAPGVAPADTIPFAGRGCDLLPPKRVHSSANELPVTLFPNPVKNRLFINRDQPNEPLIYELFHQTGKLIRTGRLADGEGLMLANLPNGVYFLRLCEFRGTRVTTKKLVKH